MAAASPNSEDGKLAYIEKRILETHGVKYDSTFIPIRFKNSEIYTVHVKPEEDLVSPEPIVLIQGFGAGVAWWCANLQPLARNHTVYAFDLLGFGRSSRPSFSSDASVAELQMVESIEDWRKAVGIEKMTIVAHSFGAYLASSYALEHPTRVRHLVLVEPWGFAEKVEPTEKQIKPYDWMMFLGGLISYFNPLASVRLLGPYAPSIMRKIRPDLLTRYPSKNSDDIYKYIYLTNSSEPTGESAFMAMSIPSGWAKRPMIRRFNGIDPTVDVTFVYGSKSFVEPGPAFDIQSQRNGYVDIQMIRCGGHHVYADEAAEFNKVVLEVIDGNRCNDTDSSDTYCA
ncbi:unnamed protein product [Caenorhabditis auriculariae]|uniref:AB hydrolase-1 domain-containing protein n=1 Tax=Caenorhabditis auriculariae TaxID=2777116 RepID=A0A8S1GLZ4_9PELO|nr:unnamed protein product [Caenorhabditis auriculariae]